MATENVIARSAGAGISAQDLIGTIASNTLFANGGPGVLVEGSDTSPTEVRGNIGAFNTGAGLQWLAPLPPDSFGCNDWFDNVAGATLGISPSPTDLAVNPLFCNLALDDVHLSTASPLANAGACGLIGALGTGCGAATAVEPLSMIGRLTLGVAPIPASGLVQFTLRMDGDPATLEVFDISGARRWDTVVPVESTSVQWEGTSHDGRRLPAGVYFARLSTRTGQSATARVLLTH